jgi:hypothetical protein
MGLRLRLLGKRYHKDVGICGIPEMLPEYSDDDRIRFAPFSYLYRKRQEMRQSLLRVSYRRGMHGES